MNDKLLLSDFICQLHKKQTFHREFPLWSEPFIAFCVSTEDTMEKRAPRFVKALRKKGILREDISDLICVLGDWKNVDSCEGIFFTTKALYVNTPKNNPKSFHLRYDDITELVHEALTNNLEITDYEQKTVNINSPLWNVGTIKLFLEFASGLCNYAEDERKLVEELRLPHFGEERFGAIIAGTVYGNVGNASTIYGEEKFHAARGHGFAAERANTLFDKATGHDARIVGDDNAKNGPDRMVDGVFIQTKYCKTGSKCISECFEDGKFRYMNADGTPMQIEVPSDHYEAAIQAMESRISRGEVPGVTNPEEAKNIVRKGRFTYEQAKNIAKSGTVESLTYDAVNGAIIASTSFGLTAVISFATSVWSGEEFEVAIKNAALEGLKVGGVSFVTAVLAGQLTKAGLNSMLVGSSEAVIRVLGPKASAWLANAFRQGPNIYGAAAMKSASKMLRGNVITGVASVVILSVGDVVNIFRGRISGGQLLKNVINTTSSVAGGTVGWVGGAAAGAAIGSAIPIIGTTVGGVVGGLLGAMGVGTVANNVSDGIMSNFVEDDAKEMIRIIESTFSELAVDYLLNEREVEHVIDHLGEDLTAKALKNMFASEDRKEYARRMILPHIEREVGRRAKIGVLSQEKIQQGLRLVLEEMADEEAKLQVET